MAKLYLITNEATDDFFVVAADEAEAESKYTTFLGANPDAPSGDGTTMIGICLVASDTKDEVAPWVTFVE